jgi:serine/threonine-protein kinase
VTTELQPSQALPAGTVLDGAYRITRLLGQGGMGTVYEAHHTGAGKRLAVKVMHRGLMAYPELRARFQREAKVTSELAHANIVSVFGFGAAPSGEPYLVMEFLEGEDLQTRMEKTGPLPLEAVAQIVTQVAAGLAEAHVAGVVHRDLKPDNVFLVRAPGEAVFAKVVDFGISKVLKASATKLTVARAVFGTPEYMAPEQAEGRQDLIDHRSDQWSLACVAWVALTGCLPFSGPDATATLNQVLSALPTPPREGAPRIPEPVEAVLRRAMSRRPSDRFPTIRAFARYFEAAAAQVTGAPAPAPVAATPGPIRQLSAEAEEAKTIATPRRRPLPVLAMVTAALVVLIALGAFFRPEPVARWLQQARDLLGSHR